MEYLLERPWLLIALLFSRPRVERTIEVPPMSAEWLKEHEKEFPKHSDHL